MTVTNLKTPAAASALGMTYTQLMSLLRYGKIPLPSKDSSGHYIWSAENLEAVRLSLRQRDEAPAGTGQ
jgi:hypothetical protein